MKSKLGLIYSGQVFNLTIVSFLVLFVEFSKLDTEDFGSAFRSLDMTSYVWFD